MQYLGVELVDIPSGMGGTLPAAVAADDGDKIHVICLHDEFFPGWLLTVARSDTREMTYKLNRQMEKLIKSKLALLP